MSYSILRKDGNIIVVGDTTDEIIPVVEMLDIDGDECDMEDAVVVVAGPTKAGEYLTIEVEAGPVEKLQ